MDATEAAPPAPPASPDIVERLFEELQAKVRTARPNEDLALVEKAYRFAAELHKGQKRDSGDPYMIHPLQVALLLADMKMDQVCLAGGLLHDVVEDTPTESGELTRLFGEDVARIVNGVTKLAKLDFYSREERQAESVRKMLLAMVSDIRVVLVKLADRLHNMRTLGALSADRQQRIAHETMDIYAPIAHRLGMGKIRAELEDLAFQYIEPEAAAQLTAEIESKRHENEQYLKEFCQTVEANLKREGIPARVESRVKRAYSVWQKLKKQKITLDEVYDLLALRIVTDSVRNCYGALGVIHNDWQPIPGRIKDFIATPRPNLYRSLHTSVIGPHGLSLEVQIRTEEMHRVAEEGIAAHWKYKEGKKGPAEDDQRIAWLRQLVEWQREVSSPDEFMSNLKVDLYPDEVYTFTPRGRVIVLPRDASPIDFAYAIHSDVGQTCVGAKVNGRMVPLKYALRNGDVVEILRQPGHTPSRDWLMIVKTARAKSKIKHFINTVERARAIEIGEKYLEKEARRLGVQMARIGRSELERVSAEYGYAKVDDLYAALGYGRYSARQVLQKAAPDADLGADEKEPAAKPAQETDVPPPAAGGKDLVIKVSGIDDLLIYRAQCCNPIPGEQIVGYITRGKGVAVHAVRCSNVQNLMYEPERRIAVEWAKAGSESFPVKMLIYTDDRPGMLNQLTAALFHEQTNIRTLEARADDKRGDDSAIIDVTVEIRDKKQFERVVANLRRISGVRDIERVH